jgi:transglutaminase-like putative cysteine protease
VRRVAVVHRVHPVIYTVRHVTEYDYATPVDLGTHMLHLQPRTLPWQAVLRSALVSDPVPAELRSATDCFGNAVAWIFLDTAHSRFVVSLDATVDVRPPFVPPADATPAWEDVSRAAYAGGRAGYEAAEFLFDSPMAPALASAGDYARPSFPPGRPVLQALIDLNDRIGRDFAFRAGVTTVHTTVAQVLTQRAGVCQDFSHLMIAGLRALGLPARYVSGYIQTKPPPGQPRKRGCDQSHAWVACWLGADHGWVDIDPTNGVLIRDEHVVLGWGRDFSDVSPLSGVILGGGEHTLKVSVDLEPVHRASAAE